MRYAKKEKEQKASLQEAQGQDQKATEFTEIGKGVHYLFEATLYLICGDALQINQIEPGIDLRHKESQILRRATGCLNFK